MIAFDLIRFRAGDKDDGADARGQAEGTRTREGGRSWGRTGVGCICTLHKRLIRSLVTSHVSGDVATRTNARVHAFPARETRERRPPLASRQERSFPSSLRARHFAGSKCSHANAAITVGSLSAMTHTRWLLHRHPAIITPTITPHTLKIYRQRVLGL